MQMCVAHAFDRFAHAQQNRVRVEGAILDQMTRDRIDRIVLENDEVSAFLQAAVAIADGHLPILRWDVVKDAGGDHQVELCVRAKLIHRREAAVRILASRYDETFGRRIAADDLGVRKDVAQVRHAAADATTKIEDGIDRASQLLRQFDFVTSEITAVAVEEVRLGGEDRLVLPGILIEIDPRHGTASARDRRNGYANKNNKQLRPYWPRLG